MGHVPSRCSGRVPEAVPPKWSNPKWSSSRGPDQYWVRADRSEERKRAIHPRDIEDIHGDIREYRTKIVKIGIGLQTFTCRVGVVPWLDCGVLI